MQHFIYLIAAVLLTVTMSSNLMKSTRSASERVFINEVETQLTGVAYDVLENIERRGIPFDESTDESQLPKPVKFPVVRVASELTPASEFGGCNDYDICTDVDDFHGMTITKTTQGTTFVVALSVRYVSESDPTIPVGSQTFTKEITARVSIPSVLINGIPISVSVSRLVTYHRITWKSGVWL